MLFVQGRLSLGTDCLQQEEWVSSKGRWWILPPEAITVLPEWVGFRRGWMLGCPAAYDIGADTHPATTASSFR